MDKKWNNGIKTDKNGCDFGVQDDIIHVRGDIT